MINRLKKMPKEYKTVLKAASIVALELDYSIYIVGGVVRDLLLRKSIFDLDIVVEGDAINLVGVLSSKLNVQYRKHHTFGTATIEFKGHKFDFATARKEDYSYPGALPHIRPANLSDDLYRRDFTINAMAISINKNDYGLLIDKYNGSKDLKAGIIRILHKKSFIDDPTRILRAIRFEQRFSFKLEAGTSKLLKKAISAKALKSVSPHRLRDEIVLILKEPQPYEYIKRLDKLTGLTFIHKELKLKKNDYGFFREAQVVSDTYIRSSKELRKQKYWLLYLAKILIDLPSDSIRKLLSDYAFKKGERIIILSIKSLLFKAKKLKKPIKKSQIYQFLNPLSYEAILFFYIFYQDKIARGNIDCFFKELVKTNLRVRGKDLQRLGLVPDVLFGKVFEKLIYVKIDKGIATKKGEMVEALNIFKKLSRKNID